MKFNPEHADIFDVFGDYSHVVPVELSTAVENFKKYHEAFCKHISRKDLGTVDSRKKDREHWERIREEAEICLFRSIIYTLE